MQTITIRTTQNVVIKYRLAGVGDRMLAYLIDSVIITFYTILAWIIFFVLFANVKPNMNVMIILGVFMAVPIIFYHLLFEIFMDCQSPGKRAMKIKVIKLNGTQPTVGDLILRWLCRIIDISPIGVVLIAATEKAQRLGDIAAGTTVVKVVSEDEITANEVFISPEATYAATFPQVVQLTAKDIELIQRALEASKNFGNHEPVMIVTEKIKSFLSIQTDLPPSEFLYTIVKDYNHLSSI